MTVRDQTMKLLFLIAITATLGAEVVSNNTTTRAFPVSGASKLILDNVEGSLTITGANTNEIRIVVKETWTAENDAMIQQAKQNIRIDMKQEGGTVDIYVDGPFRDNRRSGGTRAHRSWYGEERGYRARFDFEVQVPHKTELDIATVNAGAIRVTGVQGPFEVRNVNGSVEMTDAAVGGTAHTVNGKVNVSFASVPTAESSFKTINGAIHAAIPAGLNADVRVKTFNGEAYTDFDTTALPAMEPSKSKDGARYVYKADRAYSFRIGAGGVPMRFETLNGEIRIARRGN